jgi:hypothetical protein
MEKSRMKNTFQSYSDLLSKTLAEFDWTVLDELVMDL